MANEGLLLAGTVRFGKEVGGNIWYPAGETDKLEIQPQSTTKSMTSKAEGGYGQSINSVALPGEIKISLALKEVNRTNIVKAFLGTDTDIDIAAGSGSGTFALEHGAEIAFPHKRLLTVAINAVKASLATGVVGDNNALNWEAVNTGIGGNAITVELLDPSANDATLSIVVTDNAIAVNLATDAGGVITSTGLEVLAAAMADSNVTNLVNVTHTTGSDGSGVVTALAVANLTSGSGFVEGTDYTVNKRDGFIIIPVTSTIPDGSDQPIAYTYAAYKGFKVDGATLPSITVPIKLNGVNLAKDNTPVEVIIRKVLLSPSKGVDLMSDDFVVLEFEGVAQLVEGETSPFTYTEIEV